MSFVKKRFFSTFGFSRRSGLHPALPIQDAFNRLDKDRSGSISLDELRIALTKRGRSGLERVEVEALMQTIDVRKLDSNPRPLPCSSLNRHAGLRPTLC